MTQRIDLMPESCRQRLGRRSQVRRWASMYAVTLSVLAIGLGAFELAKSNVRAQSASLERKVSLDAQQRVKAQALESEIDSIEAALERHERLAWPIEIEEIIAAIGSVTPESVFLTDLSLIPRQDRAARPQRSAGANGKEKAPAEQPKVRLQVECEGFAPDDHAMAEFIKGLERHPMFEQIALEFAQKASLGGVEVRSFSVTCQVDMSARYVVEETPTPETTP